MFVCLQRRLCAPMACLWMRDAIRSVCVCACLYAAYDNDVSMLPSSSSSMSSTCHEPFFFVYWLNEFIVRWESSDPQFHIRFILGSLPYFNSNHGTMLNLACKYCNGLLVPRPRMYVCEHNVYISMHSHANEMSHIQKLTHTRTHPFCLVDFDERMSSMSFWLAVAVAV